MLAPHIERQLWHGRLSEMPYNSENSDFMQAS